MPISEWELVLVLKKDGEDVASMPVQRRLRASEDQGFKVKQAANAGVYVPLPAAQVANPTVIWLQSNNHEVIAYTGSNHVDGIRVPGGGVIVLFNVGASNLEIENAGTNEAELEGVVAG